jgi:hypothetical protein
MPDQNITDGIVPESEIRWTPAPPPKLQQAPATADWPAIRDYRDLVIQELASSEAILLERVASLEADVDGYRMLAQESMTLNVRLTAQLDAARREIAFLKYSRAAV